MVQKLCEDGLGDTKGRLFFYVPTLKAIDDRTKLLTYLDLNEEIKSLLDGVKDRDGNSFYQNLLLLNNFHVASKRPFFGKFSE